MIGGSWFPALVAATLATLVATPLLARWSRGRSRRRTPLATAAGIPIGILAGLPFFVDGLDRRLGLVLVGALWLWAAGQLMERGLLPPPLRRLMILVAAGIALAADVRLHVTGVEGADVVVTLGVVWLATSAWRSAETRDGLLLGWATIIAAGSGLIAGLGGQDTVAALAAAISGAAVAFWVYVTPPTAARLRAGGALSLGYLAVVLALIAEPSEPAPVDALPVALILAFPVVEALVAGVALLRGRGSEGRVLGLIGRWRALGMSRGVAALAMLTLQLGLTCLAILVARGVLDPAPAGAAAGAALVLATLPGLFARVDAPRGRWPRWLLLLAVVAVGGVVVMAVPAGLALLEARTDVTAAADAAEQGLAAARRGEVERARERFSVAEDGFRRARQRLTDPAVSLGRFVPVLGPNLDAARDLVDVGLDLSQAGRSLADTADPDRLRIVDATVDLTELGRLQPEFARAAALLTSARERVDAIDTAFLVAPVEEGIGTLERRLDRATRDANTAALASRLLPEILGRNGPRRYFLAVQNNAEGRATGGFIGSYGDITASGGRLELGDLHRIRELLPEDETAVRTLEGDPEYVARYSRLNPTGDVREVNLTPDVPAVSLATVGLLEQAQYGPVDGIITVDPFALRAILELTGPIRVDDWPDPITAENVIDITLFQEYVAFEGEQGDLRETFLGDVAKAAWDAFSNRDLGSPANVVEALAEATRGRHLTLWFADPEEQRLAVRAGADGAIPRDPADLLMLTTQNGAGNKIDYFLRRGLDYDVTLVPGRGSRLEASGRLQVSLENTAPAEGLPVYVIGPNFGRAAGENFSLFSAYSSLRLRDVATSGGVEGVSSDRELDRWVYWNFVSIPSQTTRTIDLELGGPLRLTPDGYYELALVPQPLASPDRVSIDVRLPEGWRFASGDGLEIGRGGRVASYTGTIDQDRLLRVKVVRDHGTGLWDRLRDGG